MGDFALIKRSGIDWERILPGLKKEKFLIKKHQLDNVELHDHAFLELTYILEGKVKHTRDGQETELKPGDYLIVDFGSMHSYEVTEGKFFKNLDCLFLPELLDPTLKNSANLRELFEHYLLHFNMRALTQNPAGMIFHDGDGRVLNILRQMEKESENKQPGYTEMIRCCLVQILLLTVRNLEDAAVASTGQDISSFLSAYVAEHYMEQISLSTLAEKLNYSMPYISRRFKADVGISFVEYLQNYRIMQSCRLLSTSRRNVADVAERVGYKDVKFFVMLFKRITGISPAAFRRASKVDI